MSILLVVLILIVLIVVHELGHFVVAKILKVRVEEFGLGYPPRAYSFGRIGDTLYTFNWLPFGGFVKLYGEDPTMQVSGQSRRGNFSDSSRAAQALILVAGVAANILLAWTLFSLGFMSGMPSVAPEGEQGARLFVSRVVSDSPAHSAGLLSGDEILGIKDSGTESVVSPTSADVIEFVRERPGEPVEIEFRRRGEIMTKVIVPSQGVLEENSARPALGVALTSVASIKLPFGEAVSAGFFQTGEALAAVVVGVADLIGGAFAGSANLQSVVGPVGLVGVVDEASRYGAGHLFGLAAFISVNLAIINLIPIPALDGGRLVIVGLEALIRRKTPNVAFQVANLLGFAFIIFLMVAVTYNDIARLIT